MWSKSCRLSLLNFGTTAFVYLLAHGSYSSYWIYSALLKAAEIDLDNARTHVEQFKAISQASEEALNSMNATFDQYKQDTEKQLGAKTVSFATA